jgi:hypothetical protein
MSRPILKLSSYLRPAPRIVRAFATAVLGLLASWWTGLNYVRMTVGGIGWLCALRALSLSGGRLPNPSVVS